MSSNRSIPAKDADFNAWQELVAKVATTNTTAWLLDPDWMKDVLTPLRTKWKTVWAEYETPSKRTSVITSNKRDIRREYEKALMKLVANLRYNTKVTDADRRTIGIHIRDEKPTPVPVPTTFPTLTIDSSISGRLIINYRETESNSSARPKGINGAEIKWLIADEKPSIGELTQSRFNTRSPYTLILTDLERTKKVWICARWINTRGEEGPWSTMEDAVVT